jgi:hypothetical protein
VVSGYNYRETNVKEVEQELNDLSAILEDMAAELIAAIKPWRDRIEEDKPVKVA